jgi:hypothetical protein
VVLDVGHRVNDDENAAFEPNCDLFLRGGPSLAVPAAWPSQ